MRWLYNLRAFRTHYFGFRYVLFPINVLSKQKRAMRRGMRKTDGLKVRYYADCVIDLNEYLAVLPESKECEKFVIWNSMIF